MKNVFLLVLFCIKSTASMSMQEKSYFLPENIGKEENNIIYMRVGKKIFPNENIQVSTKNKIFDNLPILFQYEEGLNSDDKQKRLYSDLMEQYKPPCASFIAFYKMPKNLLLIKYFKTIEEARGKGYGDLLFSEFLASIFNNDSHNDYEIGFKAVKDAVKFYERRGAKRIDNNINPKMKITKIDFLNSFKGHTIINNPHMPNLVRLFKENKKVFEENNSSYDYIYPKNVFKQMKKRSWSGKNIYEVDSKGLPQKINFQTFLAMNNLKNTDFSHFSPYEKSDSACNLI